MFNWVKVATYVQSQPNPDINWVSKEMDYYYWWVLTLALSVGMFIIAFATNVLARRWHLIGNGSGSTQR